jgi:septal ring factor EnvC (AmiA/AmiB activator)
LIFRKNDIFQGRLIYFQQQFQFTGNFCFHPEKTHRYIKPEIKIISKTQTKNTKDLIKLDKQLIKENKKIAGQDTQIEKTKEKIKNTDSENKIAKLNQSLAQLTKEKEQLVKNIEELEQNIFVLKHDKIKVEGNKQINKLINKLAYMNLKWERSRQIEISDIYKN